MKKLALLFVMALLVSVMMGSKLQSSPTPFGWVVGGVADDICLLGLPVTMVIGGMSDNNPALRPVAYYSLGVTSGAMAMGFISPLASVDCPGDKWVDWHTPLHVVGEAEVTTGLYYLGRLCHFDKKVSLVAGAVGGVGAGAAVEAWQQWSGRGKASYKDFAADMLVVGLNTAILQWKTK